MHATVDTCACTHLMADVWAVERGVLAVPPQEVGVIVAIQQLVVLAHLCWGIKQASSGPLHGSKEARMVWTCSCISAKARVVLAHLCCEHVSKRCTACRHTANAQTDSSSCPEGRQLGCMRMPLRLLPLALCQTAQQLRTFATSSCADSSTKMTHSPLVEVAEGSSHSVSSPPAIAGRCPAVAPLTEPCACSRYAIGCKALDCRKECR